MDALRNVSNGIRRDARGGWRRLIGASAVGFLLGVPPAPALDPAVPLSRLGVASWRPETGDPLGAVSALTTSREGYLWLGTEEGAARFDGLRFEVFDVSRVAGLTDDDVYSILDGGDGTVFIGTSAGLFRLLAATQPPKAERVSDATIVWSLARGPDGCVWAATLQGLFRWAGAGARRVGPPHRATGVAVASDGTVIAGYGDGLRVWRRGNWQGEPERHASGESVLATHFDPDGTAWFGTSLGLRRLDRSGSVDLVLPRAALDSSAFLSAIHRDRQGALWLGSERGVYRMQGQRLERLTAEEGLPASRVLGIAEDAEGDVWIATQGGLARLREERLFHYGRTDGLAEEKIWSVTTDAAGALWAASVEGGVYRMLPAAGRFEKIGELPSSPTAHTLERDGSILFGTLSSGLYRARAGRLEAAGFAGERIHAIFNDREGWLWISHGKFGMLERRRAGKIERFEGAPGMAAAPALSVYQDRDGTLWFGTYGGGIMSFRDGVFRNYRVADGLAHDLVVSLQEVHGTLLVGTAGGVTRVRGGRLDSADWRAGLPTAGPQSMAEDRLGYLWIATNKGITRVTRADLWDVLDGKKPTLEARHFGLADGMGSPECNSGQYGLAVTPDGRMWFSTMKGITVVDPVRIFVNRVPPPAAIERAVLDGREITPSRTLEMPAGTERLEIHYTGLALRDPERVRFRYRLQGFDREWIDAKTRRVAYYTNLRPGRYLFEVRAINEDGTTSSQPASLPMRLAPLLHQRPEFWALLGVAAFAVAALVHRRRVAQMAARERLKTALAEARLNALLLQLRPHFLFNTLHTILPLIEVDPRRASVMIVKLGALLRASLRTDASQLVTLEEELELLDQYVEIEKARFGRRLQVDLDVEAGTEEARVPVFLFQPLVENAIKHARSPGRTLHVLVRTRSAGNRLRLEVVDDGRPVAESGRPRAAGGLGLSNTRERLEKLFGERHAFSAGPAQEGGFAARIEIPFEREAQAHAARLPEVRHVASYADRR
jgi:ligand-binding sensor domain-containing protein